MSHASRLGPTQVKVLRAMYLNNKCLIGRDVISLLKAKDILVAKGEVYQTLKRLVRKGLLEPRKPQEEENLNVTNAYAVTQEGYFALVDRGAVSAEDYDYVE